MIKPVRIIPVLDIKNGLLVKGINYEGLRIMGDAKEFAQTYYSQGADEICYQDIVATLYGIKQLKKFINYTASKIFIPLSVGGGIKNIQDCFDIFRAGADKIIINSSAVDDPNFLKKASKIFGSANITISIQAIKVDKKYYISKSHGRDITKINPIDWAKKIEDYGAGEIIITSINNEGLKKGFDIELTKKIVETVSLPVIAHGGAGSLHDIYNIIKQANVSGVALASILHYEAMKYFPKAEYKIGNTEYLDKIKKNKKKNNLILEIKNYLKKRNILVRNV